jgi:hypothetical protein
MTMARKSKQGFQFSSKTASIPASINVFDKVLLNNPFPAEARKNE